MIVQSSSFCAVPHFPPAPTSLSTVSLLPRFLASQELFNLYRVRPSPTGMIRLIDYLLYVKDENEARRAVSVVRQLFSEWERETEHHWPSSFTPSEFYKYERGPVRITKTKFQKQFPARGMVYQNGKTRGELGVLTDRALSQRFAASGFTLAPPEEEESTPLWQKVNI